MHGYGEIVKEYSNKKPLIGMCSGCRDNFYNGNNELGVTRCWSFKSAVVVDKVGYASLNSIKYDCKMGNTLSCWHAVRR